MSKSPRNWWTLNAKVLSFRYFLQNWIIFNTFGATLSWNVTVEMKHTVGGELSPFVKAHWITDQPMNPWKELFFWLFGCCCCYSRHSLAGIGMGLNERLDNMPNTIKEEFKSKAEKLEEDINAKLGRQCLLGINLTKHI